MKSHPYHVSGCGLRRPRMGAWIEIILGIPPKSPPRGRPRMGAWIEIPLKKKQREETKVAPAWGRGLK